MYMMNKVKQNFIMIWKVLVEVLQHSFSIECILSLKFQTVFFTANHFSYQHCKHLVFKEKKS